MNVKLTLIAVNAHKKQINFQTIHNLQPFVITIITFTRTTFIEDKDNLQLYVYSYSHSHIRFKSNEFNNFAHTQCTYIERFMNLFHS